MIINSSKCHMLHLNNNTKKFRYVMGGQVLDSVESEKDVGVMIHQSLKPSLQCIKAAEKANQVLGQLSRGVTYRDKQTFLRLYALYVRPHLEYAVYLMKTAHCHKAKYFIPPCIRVLILFSFNNLPLINIKIQKLIPKIHVCTCIVCYKRNLHMATSKTEW